MLQPGSTGRRAPASRARALDQRRHVCPADPAHPLAELYDVTDDWRLAPLTPRELERLRRLDALARAHADEVVVCSPALARSRGTRRPVTLVPNGVDVEHFRRRPRTPDMICRTQPRRPCTWERCTSRGSMSTS